MKRSLSCIICPRGCALEIDPENLTVTGNTCPRGEDYARQEVTCPMRTLTTALRVANRENAMVSVKTAAPIPREKLMDAIRGYSRRDEKVDEDMLAVLKLAYDAGL